MGKAVWKVLKNLIVKSGTPPPPDTTRVDSLNVEPLKMNSLIVPKDSVAVPLDTALNPLDTVVPVSPSDVQQDE